MTGAMALFRALALAMTLALGFGPASAEAAPAERPDAAGARFEKWARQRANRKGLRLCRVGVARYSDQQPPAYFAMFHWSPETPGADDRFDLAVAWKTGRRAFRTDPDQQAVPFCEGDGPVVWEKVRTIKVGPWGIAPRETNELAVIDGELVMLNEIGEDQFHSFATDWEDLAVSGHNVEESTEYNGALFPLLEPKSPYRPQLPPPRTWVTFEKSPHGGPADSALTARVDLVGTALRIELQATDDVRRPPRDAPLADAALLRSDHFELWFCAPGAGRFCDRKGSRQLGLARTSSGAVHARWLHPAGNREKLPAVAAAGATGVAVTLPLGQVEHTGIVDGRLEGPLTAAYSDVDREGQGQEAIVATSRLRWGQGGSFSVFKRNDGGRRFPIWNGGIAFDDDEALLRELPRF
jgi:hypothetical protein